MASQRPTSPPPHRDPRWQLLAVDLDGTLINWHTHKANAQDLDALRRAAAAGIHVTICTGRNAWESAGVLAALDLSGPGVFVNGATISDMATGQHLECATVDYALAERLIDLFGSFGHATLVLIDDPRSRLPRYVQTNHAPPHQGTIEWLIANRAHAETQDILAPEYRDRIVRVGIVVNTKDAPPIEAALTARFGGDLTHHSIYSPTYDCQVIEAFRRGVNKWTGIGRLCRRLGIDETRVVAVGDDINDVPMLEGATLSFAVASARPEIQARAKRVTASQSDCGVAKVVEGLLAGEY